MALYKTSAINFTELVIPIMDMNLSIGCSRFNRTRCLCFF